jgi:hypothetical protein
MSAGEQLAQRYVQLGQAGKIERLLMTYSDVPTITRNTIKDLFLCKLYS